MRPPKRHLPAFTLIELLTVITIISLLIAILLPSLVQARRAAQDLSVQAELHAIDVGLETFRADDANNGQYPPSSLSVLAVAVEMIGM